MECLGRTLSSNASIALENLHSSILNPIKYTFTNQAPYCIVKEDKSFEIGLISNVSKKEFENMLIHETRHAAQMHLKYPGCQPKDIGNKRIQVICDIITSMVLDCEVNAWMQQRGFISSKKAINDKYEFYKAKLKNPPKKLAEQDYLELIFQTVSLCGNISHSKYEFYCVLISQIDKDIIVKANSIKKLFVDNDFTTPKGCAIIENSIIQLLNLPICLVVYNLE